MRKYLFSTGLFSALLGGFALLKSLRDHEEPFTWRTALAWVSWGLTLALAIGSITDTYRETRGRTVATGSADYDREAKRLRSQLKR